MGAYILRRLLLIIPTLLGIMALNFIVIQFAPGGPVEQVLAQIDDQGSSTDRFAGGTDAGGGGAGQSIGGDSQYRGAQGLDPDFIARLEVEFNFARIVCEEGYTGPARVTAEECEKQSIPVLERFGLMVVDYLTFDFGQSFFRSVSVIDLILEKMPVLISVVQRPRLIET
ncbi:MAG: microcin ABC transporter permease, partial [Pseudomonadota bacterium]